MRCPPGIVPATDASDDRRGSLICQQPNGQPCREADVEDHAILDAPQVMHSILSDECTGCRLCRVPCPVDGIALVAPVR